MYKAVYRHLAIRRIIPNKDLRLILKILAVTALVAALIIGVQYYWFIHKDGGISAEVIVETLTLFATVFMLRQLFLMKDINHMETSEKIFDDDSEIRKEVSAAREQIGKLIDEIAKSDIGDHKQFQLIYQKDEYENLRKVAFHYEFIGQLIYRQRLNFEIVFDTVTFPNDVFEPLFVNSVQKRPPRE